MNKTIKWASLALALFTLPLGAQDSWWTKFSVSPYGAVAHPDFGKPLWGAGLDLGYQINRTVSLHIGNTIFDQQDVKLEYESGARTSEQGWFTGTAIDETEALFRADLIRGGGEGKDRFVGFLLGSGTRNWELDDWAFGVGVGAELRLAKNISLGADSRIRAFMHHDKDVITRGFLSIRF